MVHLAYSPGPPLNDFVECFCQIGDGQGCRIEPVFPSGTIEIVVNLHDDEVRTYEQFQP